MSQGWPYMWTAMIAFVRGVIFSSIFRGSRHQVFSSTSTSTGLRSREDDRVGGDDEREVRDDDLVAGTDSERDEREVERRRAARARDRVGHAAPGGEGLLEAGDVGPERGDPVRLQAVPDVSLLVSIEDRLPDGDHGCGDYLSIFRATQKTERPKGRRRPAPAARDSADITEPRAAFAQADAGRTCERGSARRPPGGQKAKSGRGGKEQADAVEVLQDREPGTLEKAADLGTPETAIGPDGIVVLAAQPVEGRHLEDQDPVLRQTPAGLRESVLLRDAAVAEDVDRGDHVEGARREGHAPTPIHGPGAQVRASRRARSPRPTTPGRSRTSPASAQSRRGDHRSRSPRRASGRALARGGRELREISRRSAANHQWRSSTARSASYSPGFTGAVESLG